MSEAKPTDAAMRAARVLMLPWAAAFPKDAAPFVVRFALIIDRETNLPAKEAALRAARDEIDYLQGQYADHLTTQETCDAHEALAAIDAALAKGA